jgi:hypothetical protein
MDILIFIIIIIILLAIILNTFLLIDILNKVSNLNLEKPVIQEEAKVTDPFTKPAPIHSSTNHIIVPMTPTEIRNQYFKKIKEGIEYGDIAER